jgi:hypothetical protein
VFSEKLEVVALVIAGDEWTSLGMVLRGAARLRSMAVMAIVNPVPPHK